MLGKIYAISFGHYKVHTCDQLQKIYIIGLTLTAKTSDLVLWCSFWRQRVNSAVSAVIVIDVHIQVIANFLRNKLDGMGLKTYSFNKMTQPDTLRSKQSSYRRVSWFSILARRRCELASKIVRLEFVLWVFFKGKFSTSDPQIISQLGK